MTEMLNQQNFNGPQVFSAGNQQMGQFNAIGKSPEPIPAIHQEIGRMNEAIDGLSSQVEWLLEKVAPLCQESQTGSAKGSEPTPDAPSRMRADLAQIRRRIENISSRISEVKYTIEL